jgi:hypothetical protein
MFIQSTVPEVITMALEDKAEDVRAAAIHLLVDISEKGMSIIAAYPMTIYTGRLDAFRDQIKTFLPQLTPLLEVNRLRASVVELISLLAVDVIG